MRIELNKKNIKRILITRPGKVGDVLLTTPLLRNIRKNFPEAHIAYVAGMNAAPILENNPNLTELIVSDKKIFSKIIRKEKYDLALDLNVIDITAQLCVLSGAEYRAGLYGGGWTRKSYNIILKNPGKADNAVDYFLSLLELLGLKNDKDRTTEIYLSLKEKEFGRNKLKHFHGKMVGIQPACDLKGRLWPAKNFAALADLLIERYRSEVAIFQGPGEEAVASKMRNHMKQRAALFPVLKLREYLSVLRGCGLFIANEGGQLHMARSLGVPAIGIFEYSPDIDYWFHYKDGFKKIVSKDIKDISVARAASYVNRIAV